MPLRFWVSNGFSMTIGKDCQKNNTANMSLKKTWQKSISRLATKGQLFYFVKKIFWCFNVANSGVFLLRQLLIVNFLSNSSSKISVITTNTCDDITRIVNFGILIQVLSWIQQKVKNTIVYFDYWDFLMNFLTIHIWRCRKTLLRCIHNKWPLDKSTL